MFEKRKLIFNYSFNKMAKFLEELRLTFIMSNMQELTYLKLN
jgi:hypothetical protein